MMMQQPPSQSLNSMNSKPINMYLPGMIDGPDGCRILVKAKPSSWREEEEHPLKPKDMPKIEKPSVNQSVEKRKEEPMAKQPIKASEPRSPRSVALPLSEPAAAESPEQLRIRELEERLAAIEREKQVELSLIGEELKAQKLEIRRSANNQEVETLKTHMKCKSFVLLFV